MCRFRDVMAIYLFRQHLLPPSGKLSIKENISVNYARGRGGRSGREDGGEEEVGAGCN